MSVGHLPRMLLLQRIRYVKLAASQTSKGVRAALPRGAWARFPSCERHCGVFARDGHCGEGAWPFPCPSDMRGLGWPGCPACWREARLLLAERCTDSTHCPSPVLSLYQVKLTGAHFPVWRFQGWNWMYLHSWVFFLSLDLRFSSISLAF